MVHRPGSVETIEIAISEVRLQAVGVGPIDADDMHHAEGLRIAGTVVEPQTREIERRSEADLEAHDFGVEAPGCLHVECSNRVMVESADGHGGLPLKCA